jgi:hypothetical protein
LTLQRRSQRLPQKPLREALMAKVLVLYYSAYGHIERWPTRSPTARARRERGLSDD